MEIKITARNFDLDDPLKKYIHKKIDKLEHLYKRIFHCEVILEEEKIRKNVEIILFLKSNRIVVKESSTDIYASVDIATDKLKKRITRLSGRLASKRRKAVFDRIMYSVKRFKGREEESFPEPGGKIVKVNMFADKPMLPEEAKLELELMERNFIMFKNADTGEINVLYKRNNGNAGLIEPNF
ncbi:MAG: ribosome-associated translation inhibitor RaiA [Candidatus Omnitrophota bacterium]